jgi:hypothetical protein
VYVRDRLRLGAVRHRVSDQRAGDGVVTLEMNNRALGRLAVAAEFLNMAHPNSMQVWISQKRFDCKQLRGRGASNPPGRLQHARLPLALIVYPLRDIVIAAGGDESFVLQPPRTQMRLEPP